MALLLATLLLVLFAPALEWLLHVFGDPYFRGDAALLGVAVVMLGWRLRGARLGPPVARVAPIAVLVSAQMLFLANERWLDLNIVSAALLVAAAYGASGLFVPPAAWRRGMSGALLLVVVLPFGEQAEAHLGFAARRITAALGGAYVDSRTSGARGLWSAVALLVAVTWLRRARLDLAWARIALVFGAVVVAASALQIVSGAPLGAAGLAVGAVIAARGLRDDRRVERDDGVSSRRVLPALAVVTALSIAIYAPRPAPAAPPLVTVDLSEVLPGHPLALSDVERALFTRVGHSHAARQTIAFRGHAGTITTVISAAWRAHHPPEICLAAAGLRVDTLQTVEIGADRELRLGVLDGGARTAVYWFQSPTRATGDLLARMRSDEPVWVMVSMVLEGRLAVSEARALFERVHPAVAGALSR